jgi:hypothetical protein
MYFFLILRIFIKVFLYGLKYSIAETNKIDALFSAVAQAANAQGNSAKLTAKSLN